MAFAGTNLQIYGATIEDSTKEYVSTFAGTNIQVKGVTIEDAIKEYVSTFAGTNIQVKGFSIELKPVLNCPQIIRRRRCF